jgi:uncharacterized protein
MLAAVSLILLLSPPPPPGAADGSAWNAEAIERARRESKAILLVIGHPSSFGMQTLERQLAGDGPVARTAHSSFVTLRADVADRPDLAETYGAAAPDDGTLPAWPRLLLVRPDGRVFESTPPSLREGPALATWLAAAAQRYKVAPASTVTAATAAPAAPADLFGLALRRVTEAFDPSRVTVHGTSGVPYGALRLLLAHYARTRDDESRKKVALILEALARGGTRDQVSGGFHHAAGNGDWKVPEFQKLLCDNGALTRLYAPTYSATGDLLYRDVARETAIWAIREMRDSTGAFWTSTNAATEGKDGRFYLWTREDIVRTLGPDRADEFLGTYRLVPPGVLQLAGSPFKGLGSSRENLQVQRGRRVRPAIDERVIAGWNGLMIGGLATAGARLKRGSDIEAARRAAGAILERLGPARSLRHDATGSETHGVAFLQDYAYLAEGLLDLHEATGEKRWCVEAAALADAAVSRLWDMRAGGFFSADVSYGPLRGKTARDVELPSGNGVMVSVLARLARLTGESRYESLARKTLDSFRADFDLDPRGMETLAAAAAELDETTDRPAKATDR